MPVDVSTTLPAAAPAPRRLVVRAQKAWQLPNLREAWQYRELFWVLAQRDIKVRYRETVLGIAWAIVQPVTTMLVFTVISRLGKLSTDGLPPQIFYFCGMLPWLLFSSAFTSVGNSLINGQHLMSKVYFPRVILPVSTVITALIDFAIAFVVLLGIMFYYRTAPAPQIVFLPGFVALAGLTALAFGLWVGALTAQFRDVRHVTPFLVQVWFFCTPVLYSSSSVGTGWKRALLGLNPMTGVVDGLRWCVLGRPTPGPALVLSVSMTAVVLVISLFYFRRVERTFVDRM